jgi:alpha-N-arabinofuranosidase
MQYRSILGAALILASAAACGGNRGLPVTPPQTLASLQRPNASQTRIVELDATSKGPTVAPDLYGASLDTWYDFLRGFVNPSLRKTKIHLVRFPGGSESDAYHWEHGGSLCNNQGYITPPSTFDHLMKRVARPLQIDIAITLNYGSNRACNGGGEPSEAGAWAGYAKSRGYHVSFWTVGNEVYGSWEYDLHPHPHDPQTYSDAVRTGYYPAMKKADPNAQVGVVVDTPNDRAWNDVVLRKAQPFDFVEVHYYPEYNNDSDRFLLGKAIDNFAHDLEGLRDEMTAAGLPASTPIYLGEYNNDAGKEGKQSVSIVNGLYVGQMLGTLANAGVPMSTFWLAYGSCDQNGDFSQQLYGWQNFGTEALFSDTLPEYGCQGAPKIPGGTPFPTARVMALLAGEVPGGSQVRTTTVPPSLHPAVRAYGFAEGNGYAFALFNNTLSKIDVEAQVKNTTRTSFAATLATYGKAQYDKSKGNRWVGPVKRSLGNVGATIPLTLPPYSVSVLTLK